MLKKTNIQQSSRWQSLKNRLKHTFRFQIIDEQSYEVLLIFELSLWNIIMLISTLSVTLLIISFLIFSFSPLKYYTPGFKNPVSNNKEVLELLQRTETLEKKISLKDKQLSTIKNLLTDHIKPEKISNKEKETVESSSPSLIELQTSDEELKFRKQIEQQILADKQDEMGTIAWKLPSNSSYKVLKNINGVFYQFTLKNSKNISAVTNGTITSILSDKGFTVIYILHPDSYLSKYKCSGTSLVKEGDEVKAGTPLVEVRDKNSILHFELWHNDAMVSILEMI